MSAYRSVPPHIRAVSRESYPWLRRLHDGWEALLKWSERCVLAVCDWPDLIFLPIALPIIGVWSVLAVAVWWPIAGIMRAADRRWRRVTTCDVCGYTLVEHEHVEGDLYVAPASVRA